jgi:hypothetical protein
MQLIPLHFGAFTHATHGGAAPPPAPPSAVQAQEDAAALAAVASKKAMATGSRPLTPAAVPSRMSKQSGVGSSSGAAASGSTGGYRKVMPLGDDIDAYTGIPKSEIGGRGTSTLQSATPPLYRVPPLPCYFPFLTCITSSASGFH